MTLESQQLLRELARRYYWWGTAEEALRAPARIIALVMELGDWEDTSRLVATLGEQRMRDVLKEALPGWFSPRSWAYWHYRLGLDAAKSPPDLPHRSYA